LCGNTLAAGVAAAAGITLRATRAIPTTFADGFITEVGIAVEDGFVGQYRLLQIRGALRFGRDAPYAAATIALGASDRRRILCSGVHGAGGVFQATVETTTRSAQVRPALIWCPSNARASTIAMVFRLSPLFAVATAHYRR